MKERDIKLRLGTRNREGQKTILPQLALDGTPAYSNQTRKGLGTYHFVCLPYAGYQVTEEELKPLRDYIESLGKPKTKAMPMGTSKLDKSKDDKD